MQGAWRPQVVFDEDGRPRAIPGIPEWLNILRGDQLDHIIRQLSTMPRHPHWAGGLNAHDAVSLFVTGGQLTASALRLFTRISVWAGTTLNVSGEKYEYSPQELCLNHIDESSDLLERLLLAAGPLYTPEILALEVIPANMSVWHRLTMCVKPLRELHLLGDAEPALIDGILSLVGPKLHVLGAQCDDEEIVAAVAKHTGILQKITLYGKIEGSLVGIWRKNGETLTDLVLDDDVVDSSELELIQEHCREIAVLDVHSEYDNEEVTAAVRDLFLSYGQQLREAHLYSMEMNDLRAIVQSSPLAKISAALNEDPGTGLLVQEALEAIQQALYVANVNFDNEIIYFTRLDEAANSCIFLRELTLVRIEKHTLRIINDFFMMPRPALVKLRISEIPRDTVPILEDIAVKTGNLEYFKYSGAMLPNQTAAALKKVVIKNPTLNRLEITITGEELKKDADKQDGAASTSDEEYGGGPGGGYGRKYEEEHGAGFFGEYREALKSASGAGPSGGGGPSGATGSSSGAGPSCIGGGYTGQDGPDPDAPSLFAGIPGYGAPADPNAPSMFSGGGTAGDFFGASGFGSGNAFADLKARVQENNEGPPARMQQPAGGDNLPPMPPLSLAAAMEAKEPVVEPEPELAQEALPGETEKPDAAQMDDVPGPNEEFCEHTDDSDDEPVVYADDGLGAEDIAAFVECATVAPNLRIFTLEVPRHALADSPADHPVVLAAAMPLRKQEVHTTIANKVYLA